MSDDAVRPAGREEGGDGTRITAAVVLGLVLGATISAGNALLLYTGQGFLRAAGLLFSSSIMAVAAGVWAGGDGGQAPPATRSRWFGLAVALLAGGAFTMLWTVRPEARTLAIGGALAVLLILAVPCYAAGTVLAALHRRHRATGGGGVAAAALAGGAMGTLIATSFLIQNLEPFAIYYAGGGLISVIGLLEGRLSITTAAGATSMRDSVVIITGVGDRGQVGWSLARAFLDEHARVVITDVNPAVESIGEELGDADAVLAIRADLTVADDVTRVVNAAAERFGRVDALVNAAGGLSVIATVEETSPEDWHREMQRNAETTLRMSRAALPLLRESRGAIVNFASPAGRRAAAKLGAYSAAKAAVIALTRALALEEKRHGVRVNAVAPGTIDTAQNRESMPNRDPSGFVPREDIASVVVFLTSPASAGISGETIHVLGPSLD